MKRFHALFLLLIPTVLIAQPNDLDQEDLNGVVKSCVQVSSVVYEENDKEVEEEISVEEMKFNKNGYFTSRTIKHGGQISFEYLYEHDKLGRKVAERLKSSDNQLMEFDSYLYEYDDNLKLVYVRGLKGKDTSMISVSYLGVNNLLRQEELYVKNDLSKVVTYEYNKRTQLTKMIELDKDLVPVVEMTIQATSRLGYTRSFKTIANGDVKEELCFNNIQGDLEKVEFMEDGNKKIQTFIYEYDHFGNWTSKIEFENGKKVMKLQRTIAYY